MFVVGAQCSLTPHQVLDMSLPMFKAYVEGYQDHLFDLKCLAVYQGFWAGYYGNAKKPKPVASVLDALSREYQRLKQKQNKDAKVDKPNVDIETEVQKFLEMERRRLKVTSTSEGR